MPSTRTTARHSPQSTGQQLASLIKSCRDIMRKDKGLSGDRDRLPMLT
jgi:type I restriction enzyme M protein